MYKNKPKLLDYKSNKENIYKRLAWKSHNETIMLNSIYI